MQNFGYFVYLIKYSSILGKDLKREQNLKEFPWFCQMSKVFPFIEMRSKLLEFE